MIISESLQHFLLRKHIEFGVHEHRYETSLSILCDEMGIDPDAMAVPIVLKTERNAWLMAVVPLSHSLDVNRLEALLRREFYIANNMELGQWFLDAEPGAEPPFAELYNMPCIIEKNLMKHPRLFMRGGSHLGVISLEKDDAVKLFDSFPKAVISNKHSEDENAPVDIEPEAVNIVELNNRLESLRRLPAIPVLALKLIALVSSRDTSAAELAETIELDPSVTAQVMRYAGSPFFGYRGKLDSVQDAITRVLGFELVNHIALGIAASKSFNVPSDGPLGIKAYWKHALYCAVVAQSLARKINLPDRINPNTAYLCGLLHNIGVLLIGHLFPKEFQLLNHQMEKHTEKSLHEIEFDLVVSGSAQPFINAGHHHVGGFLLEKWRLPEAVVACAYEHHNDDCEGEFADYIRLIQLTNRLLAQRQIGDLGVCSSSMEGFGENFISMGNATEVFDGVMKMCAEIDKLADFVAA